MATADSTELDHSDEQATDTDSVRTLSDINPACKCSRVTEEARVSVRRSLQYLPDTDDVDTEGPFDWPDWNTLESTVFECKGCYETFETEQEAVDHLLDQNRRSRRLYELPGVPNVHPNPVVDAEPLKLSEADTFEVNGHTVRGRKNAPYTVIELLDSVGYFIATARTGYSLPEGASLEEWDPLNRGRLTFPTGKPRFKIELLRKVIATISSRCRASEFSVAHLTLYDRGAEPFLVTGYGQAFLIAPMIDSSTYHPSP